MPVGRQQPGAPLAGQTGWFCDPSIPQSLHDCPPTPRSSSQRWCRPTANDRQRARVVRARHLCAAKRRDAVSRCRAPYGP
eukprot:scaffold8735_cov129-Isochrysis_galbana.AAC.5